MTAHGMARCWSHRFWSTGTASFYVMTLKCETDRKVFRLENVWSFVFCKSDVYAIYHCIPEST